MWWRVLGVEQTDDQKTVKKAYAAIIKNVDQDSEIEEFTRIHKAYRLAMKSFRDGQKAEAKTLMPELEKDWYLNALAMNYNDPKLRFNAERWSHLLACMSFREEKEFVAQYVSFFNEHYMLTDEVWQVVEEHYPLANQQGFMWLALLDDNFSVTSAEIRGMDPVDAVVYVENKTNMYLGLLKKHFNRCVRLGKVFLENAPQTDMIRWYLAAAIGMDSAEDIDAGHNALKDLDPYMAAYLYAGWLSSKGNHKEALMVLTEVPAEMKDDRIEGLTQEAEGAMGLSTGGELSGKPWYELQQLTPKRKKQLEAGNTKKGLTEENTTKFGFWGGKKR